MSGTDLPTQKISDEMVSDLAQAMRNANLPDVLDPQLAQFIPMGVFARVALEWLVASGYRREADVLREAARDLLDNHYERSRPDIATMAGWLEMRADLREQATPLEQAQPLLAASSEVESLELVEPSEGQERSEGDGRFRSCVEGILAEGCSSCGTCVDHDGCADTDHPLADGDCAACGACATCIADCARLHGRSSDG